MLMATFTMAIGKMTKPTVSVFISISKELNTKDIGKMTNNMVKEKRNGRMARNTKAHTNTAKKKVSVRLTGPMDRVTRATSSIIISMEKELTNGRMDASSLVNGKTTKCTDEVCSSGLMVVLMKANT